MVQTRSSAKAPKSCDVGSQDSPIEHSMAPAAKKRRRDTTTKKQHRGEPVQASRLNLDVLFLIAAYIGPADLLNLARTSRSLREPLMDKSSTFVWKTVRRQVNGLPDCPADLTEPEYANLVFCARCHGCGKYTKNALWRLRKRYCPSCKTNRLRSLASCDRLILKNDALVVEYTSVDGESTMWVDVEQMESFLREYRRSSDKKQFLRDKKEQCEAMYQHADKCRDWQSDIASKRAADLRARREERIDGIFDRLKQLGYQREISYFGASEIQRSCKSIFNRSAPLADRAAYRHLEWDQIWPKLHETMSDLRSQRLDVEVYPPRRRTVSHHYTSYMTRQQRGPHVDFLPHTAEVACFPPFRDYIRSKEQSDHSIYSALQQLPGLVEEWRKGIQAELAELVEIPSRFARGSDTTDSEPSQTVTDKLRLACAMFHGNSTGCYVTYPDVLSISMSHRKYPQDDESEEEHTEFIDDRYGIEHVAAAPHIIHACGLDPHVATVGDMDRLDPRLMCQSCNSPAIFSWRHAIWHAHAHHRFRSPRSRLLQWEIVREEHMSAIRAAELPLKRRTDWSRCLRCSPRVGDVRSYNDARSHAQKSHNIDDFNKQGESQLCLGIDEKCLVEMVKEEGQVTFRACHQFDLIEV